MNEQLEVRISGRDFGISLKGYNAQASDEIRALFANHNTDLLDLVRAYLDVVHQKCELESSLQAIVAKIDTIKLPEAAKELASSEEQESEEVFCGIENRLQTQQDLDSAIESNQDFVIDSIQSEALESLVDSKTIDLPVDTQCAPINAIDTPKKQLGKLESSATLFADLLDSKERKPKLGFGRDYVALPQKTSVKSSNTSTANSRRSTKDMQKSKQPITPSLFDPIHLQATNTFF